MSQTFPKELCKKYLTQCYNDLQGPKGLDRIAFMKFVNLPLLISNRLFDIIVVKSKVVDFCEGLYNLYLGSDSQREQIVLKMLCDNQCVSKNELIRFLNIFDICHELLPLDQLFEKKDIIGEFNVPKFLLTKILENIYKRSNLKLTNVEYYINNLVLNEEDDTDDEELNLEIETGIRPLGNLFLKNKFIEKGQQYNSYTNIPTIKISDNEVIRTPIKKYSLAPGHTGRCEGNVYLDHGKGKLTRIQINLLKRDLFFFNEGTLLGFHHLTGIFVSEQKVVYIHNSPYYPFTIKFKNQNKDFLCKHESDCKLWVKRLKIAIGQRDINDYYQMDELIGEGSFATVRKGINLVTNEIVAIKKLRKINEGFIYTERDILTYCRFSEGVIRLLDNFEDLTHIYLVTEYCEYQFLDYLKDNRGRGENYIKGIVLQLANCIKSLHDNGIVHRDLKPENIMLKRDSEGKLNIKLIDVGLAQLMYHQKLCKESCGTLLFLAPEVHLGEGYSFNVDIWSLGLLIYYLLVGKFPFDVNITRKDYTYKVLYEDIQIPKYSISRSANDLLTKCLEKNQHKRININELIAHEWFCGV
jgi:hypothetical protein